MLSMKTFECQSVIVCLKSGVSNQVIMRGMKIHQFHV